VQVLRRKNNFDPVLFVPTLIESAAYAVTMGAFIVFVMTRILHIDPRLTIESGIPLAAGSQAVGPLGKVILAFGAGVHEELVFRLFMVSALLWVGVRGLKMRRFTAALVAFVISSFLFSAAHHVIGGEPWRLGVFTYRFLCGMIFASLFQFRGFAVAVYTHALYDIFVLLLG
jgi:membrane protease YdiL (CAAX protease family)